MCVCVKGERIKNKHIFEVDPLILILKELKYNLSTCFGNYLSITIFDFTFNLLEVVTELLLYMTLIFFILFFTRCFYLAITKV